MEFHFRFDKLIIPACQNQPAVFFFSSVLFPNQNSAYEQTKKNRDIHNICMYIIKRKK
jgi:hypothetical protein